MSEVVGRKRPFAIALFLSVVFQIPIPLAPNTAILLIFRLLSGIVNSAAFAIPPGVAVDMLPHAQRGIAVFLFMTCTLTGPILGPVAGSYLVVHHGWRLTRWVALAVRGVCNMFAWVVVPESHHNTIQQRSVTATSPTPRSLDSPITALFSETWKIISMLGQCLKKPGVMLLREPIVSSVSLHKRCDLTISGYR